MKRRKGKKGKRKPEWVEVKGRCCIGRPWRWRPSPPARNCCAIQRKRPVLKYWARPSAVGTIRRTVDNSVHLSKSNQNQYTQQKKERKKERKKQSAEEEQLLHLRIPTRCLSIDGTGKARLCLVLVLLRDRDVLRLCCAIAPSSPLLVSTNCNIQFIDRPTARRRRRRRFVLPFRVVAMLFRLPIRAVGGAGRFYAPPICDGKLQRRSFVLCHCRQWCDFDYPPDNWLLRPPMPNRLQLLVVKSPRLGINRNYHLACGKLEIGNSV